MTDDATHFEFLVWVDVETTGLSDTDRLLEVAAVVTDMSPEFVQVGEPFNRVLKLEGTRIADVDPVVLAMHAQNDLWRQSQVSELDKHTCLNDMRAWFTKTTKGGYEECTFHWAGRNLHFDLQFLTGDYGACLEEVRRFSHRRFDLAPIKAFVSLAGVTVGVPEETHRALPDVLGDIELARTMVAKLREGR